MKAGCELPAWGSRSKQTPWSRPAGIWTSTPGKWHAFTDKDEYCYIVKGHCALIHEDGTRQDFRTGASFLIPNGFRGYWEVVEETTKHFVIRDCAPDA